MPVVFSRGEQKALRPLNNDSNNNDTTNIRSDRYQDEERRDWQFFCFICISTALRSFEAGIVASMMADIQADLNLDYTAEGTIVASTDWGIAAGSILAIFIFRRFSPHLVLTTTMFGTAVFAFACVWQPCKTSLLLARSIGGLLWSQAATHYPVWINDRGKLHDAAPITSDNPNTTTTAAAAAAASSQHYHFSDKRKTIWLACTNVCLLVGVISGYIVGGAVRAAQAAHRGANMAEEMAATNYFSRLTWIDLYFFEGILMTACGLLVAFGFNGDLLRIGIRSSSRRNQSQEGNTLGDENGYGAIVTEQQKDATTLLDESDDLKQVVRALIKSPPFILAVAITGCISGGIVYALYFVTQVCEARGMQVSTTLYFVTAVFVTAPAPGIIVGSWIVSHLGGYTDHVVTFGVALGSAIFVLCAAIVLPVSWVIWGSWKLPFVAAFWIFAFAGAMSGPPLNGVAVSAVPHASHVASSLQFSLSNAAKIVVQQIGGYVCNKVGLIDGFHGTLIATAGVFVWLSWSGLVHAMKSRRQDPLL